MTLLVWVEILHLLEPCLWLIYLVEAEASHRLYDVLDQVGRLLGLELNEAAECVLINGVSQVRHDVISICWVKVGLEVLEKLLLLLIHNLTNYSKKLALVAGCYIDGLLFVYIIVELQQHIKLQIYRCFIECIQLSV